MKIRPNYDEIFFCCYVMFCYYILYIFVHGCVCVYLKELLMEMYGLSCIMTLFDDNTQNEHITTTATKSRPGGNSCFSIKLMLVKSISCKVEIYFYCWVEHKFSVNFILK